MDIQTPPGYFMKLADGIHDKTNLVDHTDSNSDMNSEVAYLISVEQADGTCQIVQLTEEEARSLGILSGGTLDNTDSTTDFIETATNLTNSVEATNINIVKQPTIPPNKTHLRKAVDIRKTVNTYDNSNTKEEQMGINLLTYSPTTVKVDDTSKVLQVNDEGVRTFGIFLNNTEKATNIESTETVLVNSMEVSHVKHSSKVSNKTVSHRKKVVRLKKDPINVYRKNIQKQKQLEVNLLPYSSTLLQVKGAPSQVLQITKGQAEALGVLTSDVSVRDPLNNIVSHAVTEALDGTEHIQTTPIDISNAISVNHVVKASKKAVQHRKKIVSIRKNIPTNACNDENLKNKHKDASIYSYSATNEKSQLVQLTEVEAKALGMLSKGATNSLEASDNIIKSAVETINTKNIKHSVRSTNKVVGHCKEVASIAKNLTAEVCNSNSKENSTEAMKPLGSSENPIEIIKDGEVLHSTQNLSQDYLQQIAEALQFKSEKVEEETTSDKSSNVIYRVVYPEELDLNPKPKPLLKRGRPKKRVYSKFSEDTLPLEESKPPKNMRTRSGRITRPPQHIKKDFKKIEISEVDNMETDLKIVEFEPLKTNQSATAPVKTSQLENHQKKRFIASQFRCPKCKKAYLGHTKMLKHLQKHPDHGPIPDHCKLKHDQTWNFLIDLCSKTPIGQRGLKFCKEVVSFLHNVRVLAKIFFKRPMALDKNLYFVDSTLSSVLGIESGNYVLNENELHTEVDMLTFINSKCFKDANGDANVNLSNTNVKIHNESFDLDAFVEKCQTDNQQVLHETITFTENGHHIALNGHSNNDFSHKLDPNEINKNSKCSTLEDTNFPENKISFDTIRSSEVNDFSLNCDITSVSTFNSELQKYDEHIISDFAGRTISSNCVRKSPQLSMNGTASQAHEQKSMSSDLSLHSELLSDNSLLNSLPNLRTSVEELMLNNVDSTQVTNLLDNSTSSDEVMNVDQFVNERFKNLTESDLELPNTSLNLDLPSLDLFQFHTS